MSGYQSVQVMVPEALAEHVNVELGRFSRYMAATNYEPCFTWHTLSGVPVEAVPYLETLLMVNIVIPGQYEITDNCWLDQIVDMQNNPHTDICPDDDIEEWDGTLGPEWWEGI